MNTELIDIKYAQNCIAVKEKYSSLNIYGTDKKEINVTFCIDRNYLPCKVCIFKGNTLVPVSHVKDITPDAIIKGKKGIYSRLECVMMVCKLKGYAVVNNNTVSWQDISLDLYRPLGTNRETLTTALVNNLRPDILLGIKNSILNNLGVSITDKMLFIKRRT